jgi:hypothetical protein
MGVIAGMGTFIAVEGIGISTGLDWSWEPSVLLQQLEPARFGKAALTAALAVGLSVLKTRIAHPILTPIYFVVISAGFFLVLQAFRIPLATARASGWLFSFEDAAASPSPRRAPPGGCSPSKTPPAGRMAGATPACPSRAPAPASASPTSAVPSQAS